MVIDPANREVAMANKDRGGKNTKTTPSKNLKQKRQAKKEKKAATTKSGRPL
jgi:hypothetical protein